MRKGDIAGVLFITSKPIDAFVRGSWNEGFKFLPVNFCGMFEDCYLPATVEANEYPNLLRPLQTPCFDPKWKSIDLAATYPG